MNPTDEVFLGLLPVALFGLLLFLRVRFPNASKRSETAVLVSATVLFLSVCSLLLPAKRFSTTSQPAARITVAADAVNR
jgi:hypothetical protein